MSLSRRYPINNEYTLGPELGRGGFSAVYLATDRRGGTYAVKTERRSKQDALKLEFMVYNKIRKEAARSGGFPLGIPKMFHFDRDFRGHRVMVMECLGQSVADRMAERNKPFSLKTVLMIGIQALSRLEYLHSIGIIHRDIKPENLLTGRGERRDRIYIADFGLCYEFKDRRGRHMEETSGKGFMGTYRYASIQSHLGKTQSRRSDLESLAYTLIFAAKSELPWMKIHAFTHRQREKQLVKMKRDISPNELCKGLPREFTDFVRYVRGLSFSQKPSYDKLRNLLESAMTSRGYRNDRQFDWV